MKRNGFTLVEILIVFTIIILLSVMSVGILNSIGATNKGRDAQRKKDLNRIKIAFEDYFNDKGYYPKDELVDELIDKNNCGKNIANFPNLKPWPCDPNGSPYKIIVGVNKFIVVTYLENKKDKDIPNIRTVVDANYGVSSSNILWYDGMVYADACEVSTCFSNVLGCVTVGQSGCTGDHCFLLSKSNERCAPKCKVKCCGPLCPALQN